MVLITFIIPIRHPDNARNWHNLKERLSETIRSITNQSSGNWECILVANYGADLPNLSPGMRIVWVDFPPNDLHEYQVNNRAAAYQAVRLDKGRRVLAGMLSASQSSYFMVVDDDDLISRNVVAHVAEKAGATGWSINKGYVWTEGGHIVFAHDNFHHLCGTSLIVRSDLYNLPQDAASADVEWIKSMLGSHIQLPELLARRGVGLRSFPLRAIVYRVGHDGSHSRAPGILRKHVFNRGVVKNPMALISNLLRLRILRGSLRREFFGSS